MRVSGAVEKISVMEDGRSVMIYKKKPGKRKVRRKRAEKVWKDIAKGRRFL